MPLTKSEQDSILEYIRWRSSAGPEPHWISVPMWLVYLENLENCRRKIEGICPIMFGVDVPSRFIGQELKAYKMDFDEDGITKIALVFEGSRIEITGNNIRTVFDHSDV
jgi:hypothetical protein